MPRYDFTYNGINASAYGMNIEKRPEIPGRKEDVEYEEVEGREETLTIHKGFYENIEIVFNCSFKQGLDECSRRRGGSGFFSGWGAGRGSGFGAAGNP